MGWGSWGTKLWFKFLPVQVGLANRVTVVGPVDMATVHRHSIETVWASDEALVHVLSIHIGPAYGVIHVIRPIDLATIHGHPKADVDGVNEGLVDVLRVRIGAADRIGSNVCPIDRGSVSVCHRSGSTENYMFPERCLPWPAP